MPISGTFSVKTETGVSGDTHHDDLRHLAPAYLDKKYAHEGIAVGWPGI